MLFLILLLRLGLSDIIPVLLRKMRFQYGSYFNKKKKPVYQIRREELNLSREKACELLETII